MEIGKKLKREFIMGHVISRRRLTPSSVVQLTPPVLLCSGWHTYEKAILDAGYQVISLNLPLAKLMVGKDEMAISLLLTPTVIQLLPNRSPVYLDDYEILFNPAYKLDIIRLFLEISRYNKLIVKWRHGFDGEILTYAEPGYEDYTVYRLRDYEITCVN